MLARRKDRLDDLCEELGERAVSVACDVTDTEALETAIGEAARAFEGLDAVVAAAGRAMAGGIVSGSPHAWRELFDLNLVGPLATVRYAVAHFPEKGCRDVVLVGSAAAITPMPGTGIYSASKAGLRAAFESLRLELAPDGIRATHVVPGMFETEGLTIEGMAFDGDVPPDNIPWFAPDSGPASATDLADTIAFMISRPEGFCINELVARPTGQLNP